jgi:hypothetical protein
MIAWPENFNEVNAASTPTVVISNPCKRESYLRFSGHKQEDK